ncbi:hypothetical protein K0M31_013827 [Melipona bicolor]|uniref:Uncharacterized protein n=1 Tax=Melipona bicolor TaxID=60889 RepID=A0AA40G8I9_9HYME|nr:hypothetical protein K0M31_013827 [Melipona bicolor]
MSASGQAADYYRRMNMNESRRGEERRDREAKKRNNTKRRERDVAIGPSRPREPRWCLLACLLTALSGERDGNSGEKSRNEDGGRWTGDELRENRRVVGARREDSGDSNKSEATPGNRLVSVVLDSPWLYWRFEPRFTVRTGNMGSATRERSRVPSLLPHPDGGGGGGPRKRDNPEPDIALFEKAEATHSQEHASTQQKGEPEEGKKAHCVPFNSP